MSADPQQLAASDPRGSAFVSANAGSGKTSTLVDRVARLLLRRADPASILCVTYTKAAAAEMQRRLFTKLGDWAVADDATLNAELARIGEQADDLSAARALFARALETPGGLKIQTIHAFCEKLLRRFPLEAGVSPSFTLLEDAAAAELSAAARDAVALAARDAPASPLAEAYAHLAVQIDLRGFEALFGAFEARREALTRFFAACAEADGVEAATFRACGLTEATSPEAIEAEALAGLDTSGLRAAALALLRGSEKTDQPCGQRLLAWLDAPEPPGFEALWALFSKADGEPRKVATASVDAGARLWLETEQGRLDGFRPRLKAARIARDSVRVLRLAAEYVARYEAAKRARRGLDFADLIARTRDLLTTGGAAAWVLYKLDGGIDHLLLDEAQDTAPEQWEIVRALTAEFFAGAGADPRPRSVFAVGDPKQSIYSFQGAAPERFLAETRAHLELVEAAGGAFRQVDLLQSWRSTPQVLSFVDAVFATPQAQNALAPDLPSGHFIVHRPNRDQTGGVDVWPLEAGETAPEVDAWAPLDVEPPQSANKKLALRLAREIAAMIARGEAVHDKRTKAWRPMRPGDVLILVRRRKALFHELIRALKREGVPVGGQDRLTLSDHIVFKDLLALARFALFPADDLTLAALLRSPFCDIDEAALFDLAWRREGGLWARLAARAGERREWSEAHAFLDWVRESAARLTPFEFFAHALSRLDAAGRAMRQRLLTRLGREADDALKAFLAEALKAEQRGVHDLETFAAEMAATAIEVKREQEDADGEGPGEVRVMTVHGAKGLEAPLVILPDTTSRATAQGPALFQTPRGGFLWAPRKAEDCAASAQARLAREQAAADEAQRLLYVALTRARDRLIVCGARRADRLAGFETGCWYELIDEALARPPLAPPRSVEAAGQAVRRFGADPSFADRSGAGDAAPPAALPPWTRQAAPADRFARYASPSAMAEQRQGPSPSPLDRRGGLGRYRRGALIHRLLQLLPDIAPAERAAAAAALLAREPDLADGQRREIAAAALGVLADPRFAEVFGPGSRAEAPLAGAAASLPPGLVVSGRLDRLLVTEARVLVVDFKTNRPSPARIEDADPAYVLQMALYVAVLREIFPGRPVVAALVWTDGAKLMPVPENLIAEALAKLARAG